LIGSLILRINFTSKFYLAEKLDLKQMVDISHLTGVVSNLFYSILSFEVKPSYFRMIQDWLKL